jgi:hypothetical protein
VNGSPLLDSHGADWTNMGESVKRKVVRFLSESETSRIQVERPRLREVLGDTVPWLFGSSF